MSTLSSQYPISAREKLRKRQGLGKDIGKLVGGAHLYQSYLAVLSSFVHEVLANVDMLGPLSPAIHVVPWLPHSMHAVLSSYTGVSGALLPQSKRLESDTVFCILDRHWTTPRLNRANRPVVDQRVMLFPQSESANPSNPSDPPRWYYILKLGFSSRGHFILKCDVKVSLVLTNELVMEVITSGGCVYHIIHKQSVHNPLLHLLP